MTLADADPIEKASTKPTSSLRRVTNMVSSRDQGVTRRFRRRYRSRICRWEPAEHLRRRQSERCPDYPLCARSALSILAAIGLSSGGSSVMVREPLPRALKKAIEWLEAEPARPWRVAELAALCGIAPRTLQKHFRQFVGRAPLAFLHALRLDRARQELLRGSQHASITEIATRFGFAHLGRFAIQYRRRYGESPSATLRRSLRVSTASTAQLPLLAPRLERPTVAVLPF